MKTNKFNIFNQTTYNRVYVQIDKSNLIYNINNIKKFTKNKLICATVKDNAYNHGEEIFSKDIRKLIDYFAVSTIEEALNFRNMDKEIKILILSHIDKDEYKTAILNKITLTVSTIEQIKDINKIAKSIKKIATLHIAINTGMNRIGFKMNDETIKNIKKAFKLKNINIEGIFSHFANCDNYDTDEFSKIFTDTQKERFDEIVAKLSLEGINFKIIHIANSAGIIYKKFDNTDMVRPGIILYGIKPEINNIDNIKLKPVLSLYTSISFIKELGKDQYISYGSTFKTNKNMKIATIQIGYGDGYRRCLSNIQDVYINGKRCRILGRITMDQTMVDVTNVKCKVGDKVELIGKHISVYELAKNASTIPYEIFCGLNKRIKREIL